jgi:hypothetical protein
MDTDPHQLYPDDLPTPFSAAEIRDASRPGRTQRFRVERSDTDPVIRVTRYVGGDAQAAEQESWLESSAGAVLGEREVSRPTWLELQEHASFPAATTVRVDEELTVPAGTFACLRYDRTDDDGTWRFWFARDLPGHPVRLEHEADGRVVFSSTLLENVPAGS